MRTAVESSNLKSVGYDDGSQTLEIEFHGGAVYEYFSVPREIYDGLMGTESVGRFFFMQVRNQFPTRLVQAAGQED